MASSPRAVASTVARAGGTLVLCALATVACNALTGAGDFGVAAEQADTGPPTTTFVGDGGGGGGGGDVDVYVKPDPPKGCPSAGRRCAPKAPENWDGPLFMYEGTGDGAPSCPTSMAIQRLDANTGTPSGTNTCSACTCGGVNGVGCSATLRQYTDALCGAAAANSQPLTSTCTALLATTLAVTVTTTATGGSCNASGGNPIKAPVTWPSLIRACRAPMLLADGCTEGQLCAPEPVAPFHGQYCIARDGEHACPAPWTNLHQAYDDYDDNRGCTNCACKAPTGVTCEGLVRYAAASPTCTVTATEDAPLSCMPTAIGASIRLSTGGLDPVGGSCAKVGDATPTGSVIPTNPTTICCL